MLDPNTIIEGKTYEVSFGEQTERVYISERTGNSPENYCWKGTNVKSGKKVRISNGTRFVGVVPSEEFGPPWFISFDIVEPSFENGKLQVLLLSVRERDSYRLVGDLPDIPVEVLPSCAEVIRNAIRHCRSGPERSDIERIHFFDDEKKMPLNVSVELSFDLWDPNFAGVEYVEALFHKIEAAKRNHQKHAGIQNSFEPNPDGKGAIYWTEKTGAVKVLWVDKTALKTLYLQSGCDIRDFAESLFGCHGHSYETLWKLLDSYEGEWFDPPENFVLFSSYKEKRFTSLLLDVLPKVYESNDVDGLKYYGRIVFCEDKSTCPEVLKWSKHENKTWLRINDGEDREYLGPFDNHSQAALEVYREYFQ